MNSILTVAIFLVGIVAVLLTIGWLGFQTEPESFSPPPEKTEDVSAVEVPPDIPEPVKRYYKAAAGSLVPEVRSVVVWGQDDIKTPWLIEFTEWKIYQSVRIPVRFELIWEDEGSPWSYWTVEGVEYNVGIADNFSVGG